MYPSHKHRPHHGTLSHGAKPRGSRQDEIDMKTHLRAALVIFLLLTIVTGIAYPALVTVIAQGVFPNQANGSIIERNGKPAGSALIGQPFDDPRYFWSRPSATNPFPCNPELSTGSN